jgi:hypothetical protein
MSRSREVFETLVVMVVFLITRTKENQNIVEACCGFHFQFAASIYILL